MNIATIKMPHLQAWNLYREYRTAIGKSGDQRDRAVMSGYKALSKGKVLINLSEVIKTAGTFESGLPRLAVLRADLGKCFCRRWQDGSVRFGELQWSRKGDINFPSGTFERRNEPVDGKAIVPLIPPQFRPVESQLKNYHILWEAEWKTIPKDPALLKKLAGDLYVVVATWDLTPLEQAVLYR